ncbi:MAG: HAD-IA family hydrolase [Lautropia sp.]|nr:HAD-IA family hydrolase [Lautropia sp.]
MVQAADRDFSRHEVIVFDWDGTIADTVAQVVLAVQRSAESLGYAVPPAAEVRPLVGLGLSEILAKVLPAMPGSQYQGFVDTYRRHYFGQRQQVDVPFDGIPALLACLAGQGRRLAVATGKSRAGLDRSLELTGLGSWFEASRCAEEGVSKPDPWMLHSLAEEMDVHPAQMLMVGDTIYDIDMAHAFGCASIGVYYDTGTPLVLERARPTALAASVAELSRLLMGA